MLTICCTGIFTVWVHAEVLQLCQTVCDPMDCSLPGSSVHGGSLLETCTYGTLEMVVPSVNGAGEWGWVQGSTALEVFYLKT